MRQGSGFIQAALNGARHPMTEQRLAAEAAAVAWYGCTAVHLHGWTADLARESLAPEVVAGVVAAVRRAAPGVEVSVSTGAWIADDVAGAIARWTAPLPDVASVNLSEPDHVAVMTALAERGVGIEAGLFTAPDVDLLAASGFKDEIHRALLEPTERGGGADVAQVQVAAGLERRLDALAIAAPRVHHGDGPGTWAVLRAARRLGLGVRVGLEDVDTLPDGTPVTENAPLYAATQAL